jgi:CubicO group peptidase (beta-lactamase class C family)
MTTTLPLARPATLGFDGERLARIDRFLAERYVEPGLLPCALLLVARKGELVHKCVLGHASLANKKRLEEDTIFRIYSMTKPVTSIALMMLAEEGGSRSTTRSRAGSRRGASMTVYRAGQPGAFVTRPVDAPMRVVDLMRHTSGLTYGFQNRTNVDAAYRSLRLDAFEAESLEALVEGLAACRSSSRPARRGTTASRPTSSATS